MVPYIQIWGGVGNPEDKSEQDMISGYKTSLAWVLVGRMEGLRAWGTFRGLGRAHRVQA